MTFKFYKEVATLPVQGSLQPNGVYAVRVGTGFDLWITSADAIAIPMNQRALKTVNGQSLVGTGDIITSISFTTDSAAQAFSAANPGVSVFSTQVT